MTKKYEATTQITNLIKLNSSEENCIIVSDFSGGKMPYQDYEYITQISPHCTLCQESWVKLILNIWIELAPIRQRGGPFREGKNRLSKNTRRRLI